MSAARPLQFSLIITIEIYCFLGCYVIENFDANADVPTSKLLKPGEASKARNITQASETFELEVWGGGGGAWFRGQRSCFMFYVLFCSIRLS